MEELKKRFFCVKYLLEFVTYKTCKYLYRQLLSLIISSKTAIDNDKLINGHLHLKLI